jgi:ribulose-phosphate 3-epimerase
MDIRIAPSILSADFANLESELDSISHADLVHVDVMDAHFVPNMTLGLPIVKRLFEVTKVPLDIHLMIDRPEHWAGQYAKFARSVTFHFEAASDPVEVVNRIREAGSQAAMSIKPETSFESVSHLVQQLDMLLVMTVEPGFGGQQLIENTVSKVSEAFSFARECGHQLSIQVDGGVTAENISRLCAAGADTFVAGTAVFQAADRNAEIDRLRSIAAKARRDDF